MNDPRIEQYARLLVERCLDVQPKWQVVVSTSPLACPLVEAVVEYIALRGAYALVRLNYESIHSTWLKHAPEEVISTLAPIQEYMHAQMDAFMGIVAPDNTRDGSDVPAERQVSYRHAQKTFQTRTRSFAVPWVACSFPTNALAQDAGMTLEQYEDFLYGACLLDWDALAREMRRRADRFDQADRVRLIGEATDLTFSLKGRPALVDDGHVNMPGGEFFYSPVEESVEGVVTFSEFPAFYGGNEVRGVRLVYRAGRIVEASAATNQEFLLRTLDSDAGARVLGEFGIGCNPGIQRHLKSTLFDEKINGTIHLAVGAGFPQIGSKNESNVHWDMVKDLRNGGQILLDGEAVQQNGVWLI